MFLCYIQSRYVNNFFVMFKVLFHAFSSFQFVFFPLVKMVKLLFTHLSEAPAAYTRVLEVYNTIVLSRVVLFPALQHKKGHVLQKQWKKMAKTSVHHFSPRCSGFTYYLPHSTLTVTRVQRGNGVDCLNKSWCCRDGIWTLGPFLTQGCSNCVFIKIV